MMKKLKNLDLAENKATNKKGENKTKQDSRKYIVNEAEMIVSNYLSNIEKEKKHNYKINKKIENILYKPAGGTPQVSSHKIKIAKPKIFIPVFPGTNCEYDLAKAFIDAGGDPKIAVFKNLKQRIYNCNGKTN